MALFDSLITDVGTKFGMGTQARSLVGEVLKLVTGGSGGIGGFLDKLRSAGFGSEVSSWVGGAGDTTMSAQSVDRALGSSVVNGIAGRLGAKSTAVTAALGFAIPKAIGLLTPGGKLPTTIPRDVSDLLMPGEPVAPNVIDPIARPAAPVTRVAEQVTPRSMEVLHDAPSPMRRWLWPLLGALVILGFGAYMFSANRPVAPTAPTAPVATQAPVAPPAAALPPRLELTNDNGVIHYTGVVHDEDARNSVLTSLRAAFGADRIQGNITVDPTHGGAPWLATLRTGLDSLKTPGVQAVFDGNSVNLGGAIGAVDRDRIAASLKTVLGTGLVFGTLADKVSDLVAGANARAATALTALKPGFTANDLVGILNQTIINFPSGSAEVPTASTALLQSAATQIRQLPTSTVLEIAGYTDSTGDPTANLTLSQQRADSIRNALIQAGVSPSMLVAKGYGNANPVASNDQTDGRFRNRRIEYHVIKT